MKTTIQNSPTLTTQQHNILIDAASSIAPSWPLDKLIAVNPLWPLVDKPFDTVATQLSAMANIKTQLPLETYLTWFNEGRIHKNTLEKAAAHYGLDTLDHLFGLLSQTQNTPEPWQNIADLADQQHLLTKISWHDEIIHQVSQFCAAHYQKQSPTLGLQDTDGIGLYAHWLEIVTKDRGLSIIMGESLLTNFFHNLPSNEDELIAQAIEELNLDDASLSFYARALLLDINGWSSYLAYLNWPTSITSKSINKEKNKTEENHVKALLTIKMAWELVIWRYLKHSSPAVLEKINSKWGPQKQNIDTLLSIHNEALLVLQIWALALEYSEQASFHKTLLTSKNTRGPIESPELQAIFCIDVRSEVFRRALEKQSDKIQTLGFAGFFGLPIEYQAKGTQFSRPQLPGLLTASITVTECDNDEIHVHHEQKKARWHHWGNTAPATFSMVESMGWWYAFKIFKQTLFPKREVHPASRLAPYTQWQLTQNGVSLTDQDKANLAKSILDTIGLKQYVPIVLLVGHASNTNNNLHAAGLECGACGGQSSEINVKVLAALLNDTKVRLILNNMGANIPSTTQFVGALHNTTTDQLTCYDYKPDNMLIDWFTKATYLSQKERAVKLDSSLLNLSDQDRFNAFIKRSNDWSQVIPEWGLANNHSFVIAPRNKTRHMDFQGRSFLHDYNIQNDPNFTILERLLTAPMLVAHWINMQYNLSVTDNFKFGSGNKVLHNAVGGKIGIFEGNEGDLRIGLPMQSIHDGDQWTHTPVRLAVYVTAPRKALEYIVSKHLIVRQLVDNDWLYLLRWDDNTIERFYKQKWTQQATELACSSVR